MNQPGGRCVDDRNSVRLDQLQPGRGREREHTNRCEISHAIL
jgi:hypothetical protein